MSAILWRLKQLASSAASAGYAFGCLVPFTGYPAALGLMTSAWRLAPSTSLTGHPAAVVIVARLWPAGLAATPPSAGVPAAKRHIGWLAYEINSGVCLRGCASAATLAAGWLPAAVAQLYLAAYLPVSWR